MIVGGAPDGPLGEEEDRPPPSDAPTETDGLPEGAAPAELAPALGESERSSDELPLSPGLSGGGGMPGARVNFGDGASAGTTARPTAARPAAEAPPAAASFASGVVEAPAAPDFACVSVIN
ncbi:hypothetical protein Air01nite_23220 [Asanoa iriomotensis]|uniref:Uncharacterized protein n=1 Tax=Asanoa iriomotensis TaxID=234613 RepID=A0ABQ4C0C0_9ACTN|nr:hypothetical protein Air01nite_23220 [Asanoa iriomotensis]